MFGRQILAAPVLEAIYTPEVLSDKDENSGWNRTDGTSAAAPENVDFLSMKESDVYLPAGTRWWDFHTGKSYSGGQMLTIDCNLKTIPMYVRAGSILPIGPDVQYAAEKPWDDLEIRVYPGADGEFTLYEDEGDNYNYEKGAYSTIRFNWDDSTRRLTIADREGSFPGMLQSRKFRVVLPGMAPKTVDYNGHRVTIDN